MQSSVEGFKHRSRVQCGIRHGTNVLDLVRQIEAVSGLAIKLRFSHGSNAGVMRSAADLTKSSAVLDFRARTQLERGLSGLWSSSQSQIETDNLICAVS